MKKINLFLMCMFLGFMCLAQKSDDILGTWLNASGEGKIKIFKSGEYYYGNLIWLKNPLNDKGQPKVDDKNPDASKRSRKIQGLLILTGFTYDTKSKHWDNGQIYDPKSGKLYSCKMSISSEGKLNIRGFIGISLIGRTESWTRAE
ncbi:MAG: DUF2147 domain-containing protein [Bacteroidota bacterium]|nr:DUF2147 domain-containing protein [Bacteroidota bacterium]